MPRKRANGEGGITRIRAKGRKPYAAVVTVGWTIEGKPIRKARSASSVAEAKMLLHEMVAARDTHRPLPDDRMTVGKWLRQWVGTGDVRPNTIIQRRQAAARVLPELSQIPLQKLRASHVEAALVTLRDRGMAHHTLAGTKSVLGSALRDAAREGYVTANAAALARLPKVTRTRLQAPTTEDVRAVLAALEGHRLRPLFVLLAGTGLRIGEALGLRWEDVSFDSTPIEAGRGRTDLGVPVFIPGRHSQPQRESTSPISPGPRVSPTLTVRYQLAQVKGEWVLAPPKTEGRTLHLGPSVVQALREQKARQAAEQLASGRDWPDRGLVFLTARGEPLGRSTVKLALDQACERAGVRHMVVHDFRRFKLTEVMEKVGPEAARLVAGHASFSTTEGYITARDGLLRAAASAGEEAIG